MTGWRLGYAALPGRARRADGAPGDQRPLVRRAGDAARRRRRADGPDGLGARHGRVARGAPRPARLRAERPPGRALRAAQGRVLRLPERDRHRHGRERPGRSAAAGGRVSRCSRAARSASTAAATSASRPRRRARRSRARSRRCASCSSGGDQPGSLRGFFCGFSFAGLFSLGSLGGFSYSGRLAWVLQALSRGRLTGLSTAGTTPFRTRRCVRQDHPTVGRLDWNRRSSTSRQCSECARKSALHPPPAYLAARVLGLPQTPTGSPRSAGTRERDSRMQVAIPDVFGLRSPCRGARLPDVATYRRVIVSDVTTLRENGVVQAVDKPVSRPRDRACRTQADTEPPEREPADREPAYFSLR